MLRYTVNRILYLIPVLLILSIAVFALVHSLPGNVIDIIMSGEENISDPAVRKALEKELGLDKPIYVQYFIWLNKVLHGNFGKSMVTRRPVSLELFERIPATIYLALVGVVLSLIIAVPLGTIAAVKRNTFVDYISQTVSLFGISIPEFWFAIMCVLLFALYLGWLAPEKFPVDTPFKYSQGSNSSTALVLRR